MGERVVRANSFFTRLVGLLNRSRLAAGEGLLLTKTRAVHTWGMRFSIDCIFFNTDNRVVALVSDLRPWRFSPVVPDARSVLELPIGTIERTVTRVGDCLEFVQ